MERYYVRIVNYTPDRIIRFQPTESIVGSQGRPGQSQLETYARRTTALYSIMGERDIDPRPPWTGADGQGKEQLAMVGTRFVLCLPTDVLQFWKQQTGVKTGFRLREYVSHTWG